METEDKGQLPFLDVLLSKQSASDHQGSFITSAYHKKTYTGLLTNYFSFTPFKYKLGLIKTLIEPTKLITLLRVFMTTSKTFQKF